MTLTKPFVSRLLELNGEHFAPIREWLTQERDEWLTKLSRVDDERTIYRIQGRIAALDNILDTIAQSPTWVERVNR